jgi:hypothetical protein
MCLCEAQSTVYGYLFDHDYQCTAIIDVGLIMGVEAFLYHRKAFLIKPETGELGDLVTFHRDVERCLERLSHEVLDVVDELDDSDMYLGNPLGETIYKLLSEAFPIVDPE